MIIYILFSIINENGKGIHAHVVWWAESSFRWIRPLREKCRISVRLEERDAGHLKEADGEAAERVDGCQLPQGRKEILCDGSKQSLPFPAVFFVQGLPPVEHGRSDGELFAQTGYGHPVSGVFKEHPEDEKEGV